MSVYPTDHTSDDAPRSAPEEALLADLNPEQRRAVLTVDGPLLVLAGAGSGKTRVITRRVAWLIRHHGVHPAEILAITFTNKAANEMKERIADLIGVAARGAWIGTFHAMMLRLLRRHGDLLGFRPSFSIFDTADQRHVMREVLAAMGISDKIVTPRDALRRVSTLKNRGLTPDDVEADAHAHAHAYGAIPAHELTELYRRYQDALFVANAMDFDDILLFALKLFRDHPDILARYQHQFRYILVDEYQDTNGVQYALVRELSGAHHNLCVVGDDDQSIYAFRGADVRNILDFEEDFPGCTVIRLEQNYRSSDVILAAANAVIEDNVARKPKRLWTKRTGGRPILAYRGADHYDEARFVARDIERRLRSDPESDLAVLYRVNALSRNIEFALRDAGIDYRIYGGLRFYDRMEIKDITAYLRLILTPDDDVAFRRAVQTPRRGIGATTIERVVALAGEHGLNLLEVAARADEWPELARTAGRLRAFADLIRELQGELREPGDRNLADFIRLVEHRSGMIAALEEEKRRHVTEAASRLENLSELLSDALEFEVTLLKEIDQGLFDDPYRDGEEGGETEPDLAAMLRLFLERTALYSDQDTDVATSAVSLMTVHSAKGLEFDAVYLIGAEESVFPGLRSRESEADMEEERRLAYVAVTRARHEFILTSAEARMLYGQTQYNPPSTLFEVIPDELIDRRGPAFAASAPRTARTAAARTGASGSFAYRPAKRTPQKPSAGLDYRALSPGARIRHASFGLGTVVKITPVMNDAILTIDFDGIEKRFLANQAALSAE